MVYSPVIQDIMAGVKEQLKPIILSSLRIVDMSPEELRDDQPLMGGDLEIDSIDILQLIIEIKRHFGIKLVTGKFELRRTREGGGDASGHYTLILHRSVRGWRIIHDHTS